MAVLPLVIAPDPRLKICSEEVDTVDGEVRKLVDNMFDTMYSTGGIGLAAVQVGVHKRVIVIDVEQEEEGVKGNPLVIINPEIVENSVELNEYQEGCLSFPDQYAKVTRPKTVKIKFLDYDGNEQIIDADGLLATCIQHEIDHINGVVFVDHIPRIKKDMIIRKLQKVKALKRKK